MHKTPFHCPTKVKKCRWRPDTRLKFYLLNKPNLNSHAKPPVMHEDQNLALRTACGWCKTLAHLSFRSSFHQPTEDMSYCNSWCGFPLLSCTLMCQESRTRLTLVSLGPRCCRWASSERRGSAIPGDVELSFQRDFRPEGGCSISFLEQHPQFQTPQREAAASGEHWANS